MAAAITGQGKLIIKLHASKLTQSFTYCILVLYMNIECFVVHVKRMMRMSKVHLNLNEMVTVLLGLIDNAVLTACDTSIVQKFNPRHDRFRC